MVWPGPAWCYRSSGWPGCIAGRTAGVGMDWFRWILEAIREIKEKKAAGGRVFVFNGHVQDATEETQQLVMALKANVWEKARSLDPMPIDFSVASSKIEETQKDGTRTQIELLSDGCDSSQAKNLGQSEFGDFRAVAQRSQVVAGKNHFVKA